MTYNPKKHVTYIFTFSNSNINETLRNEIVISFYADKYLREIYFFDIKKKLTVDMRTHMRTHLKDYAAIKYKYFKLELHNDETMYRDVFQLINIETIECYPETVSAIEYNYNTTNQVVKINIGTNINNGLT